MKQKLLLLYIACCFFACKPEERIPDKHNYNYLTAEQLSKTPYFTNPAFDTLTFVSNQNDTVVFAKTRVDSGWYREIEFDPGVEFTKYHYYQQISANYQTIKGEGSFGVVHKSRDINVYNEVQINFNKYLFRPTDYRIGTPNGTKPGITYFEELKKNNISYKYVTVHYPNRGDSELAVGYINSTHGLFYVIDKINKKEYTLLNH